MCVVGHWCNKRKGILFKSLAWWYVFIWNKMIKMHEGITIKVLERVEKSVDWQVFEIERIVYNYDKLQNDDKLGKLVL
jgi:hypothetical protein